MTRSFIKERAAPLFIIAVLAIVAYLPTLTQPFISDDYPGIKRSLSYSISGWEALAKDPVERPRGTPFIFSYAIYHLFGMRPAAFYSANILLHVLNCWLLFAGGRWRAVGYRVSFWAAAFFAVYEGHSEAIMWSSACNELLLFFFGFLSFIFWLIFLEREKARLRWLALSFFCFLPSLLSKESAVIFVVLFALPLFFPKPRLRQAPYLLPHALICIPYVISIFMARAQSLRFHNQSFVLSSPFWVTWTNSYGRMLWFWGLSATISMFLWSRSGRNQRRRETKKVEDRGSPRGGPPGFRPSILDLRSSILDLRLFYLDGDRFYSIHVRRLHAQNTEQAYLSGQRRARVVDGRRDRRHEGTLCEDLQMGAARHLVADPVAQRRLSVDEKAPAVSGTRSTDRTTHCAGQERERSDICEMLSTQSGSDARGGRPRTYPEQTR